ncbi:Avr9/Cf-9 rapidly elicited protein [Hirschfeldia incana]|nr:Avr9/Cf-9 rapidly elicited protein [Hirschfeldia incana]
MDQNVPISKKLWNIVRFLLYMVRKGVSKHKLIADFNATLKRGKNLMFHHRRRVPTATSSDALNAAHIRQEYEFSCSNTPNYSFPFTNITFTKKESHSNSLFACGQTPQTLDDNAAAARAVLELINGVSDKGNVTPEAFSAAWSPYFPGFGRTPLVRPLRVTDSPFPLTPVNGDVAKRQVDQAADDFIKKFYKNLNQQKKMTEFS